MNIHYKIHKNKKDVYIVFLHGLGGNMHAWNDIVKIILNYGYSICTIDLRGHGKSFRPKNIDKYQLHYFADDIHHIITKEKINKFIIVGHCFGGVVSSIYQYKYKSAKAAVFIGSTHKSPLRLKVISPFLTLINYFLSNYLPNKSLLNRRDFKKFINTSDYSAKRIISDILDTSPRSYSAIFYQFNQYNGEKILPYIKIPTLIITGEKDTVFYTKYGKRINELIKKSQLVTVPKANHILVINNAHTVSQLILNFINNLDKKIFD
jgi:pimeloyl-ACP methyl ester carboxylesterase